MKIGQLGRHILVEYYKCDINILKDKDVIQKYMEQAADMTNAHIVASCFHQFTPWGVSGAVIIEESHLTIHTWPEYAYAAVDLFTCGEKINPWMGFDYLKVKLKSEKKESAEVPRGVLDRINHYNNLKEKVPMYI